jgi:hypothetical protein
MTRPVHTMVMSGYLECGIAGEAQGSSATQPPAIVASRMKERELHERAKLDERGERSVPPACKSLMKALLLAAQLLIE